jgi:quinoprotein glucose dehydrogenase
MTNGEKLWQGRLPAGGQATPMTYEVNGKQYVVISAGGHGSFGTKMGDYIVAYALPDEGKKQNGNESCRFECLSPPRGRGSG